MSSDVLVGTSGWHYKHWRGPFYPERFPQDKMLSFYTERFKTVELNTTFYRLPPEGTAVQWKKNTPPDFCFAAKGSRFITHRLTASYVYFDNDQAGYAPENAARLREILGRQ